MFDILVIAVAKLDKNFPVSQFDINGFSNPYRLDRNRNGSSVIIYIWDNIARNFCQNTSLMKTLKDYLLRQILGKVGGIYHSPLQPGQYFFDSLDEALDVYCNYEKSCISWRFYF